MSTHVEVLVIGGGIHGVGVAQAAAAAGYQTLIVEKTDWAAGTSSKSSKLIHGGLRYLQTFQFKLVRESLRERGLLLKLAPELVHPIKFYIPIYDHSTYRPWQIRAGLTLYSLLSGLKPLSRFRKLNRDEWRSLAGLRQQGLQAVYCYWDGQTNDRLLTQAVKNSAVDMGAQAWCPAEVTAVVKVENGYHVRLNHKQQVREITADLVVNAAGPWVNHLLDNVRPSPQRFDVDLVAGSHLVLKGQVADFIYYLEAPQDQRAIFVMPWGEGDTLLGTTEVKFQGEPEELRCSPQEEGYLLGVLQHYFPGFSAEVIGRQAGLRVLPRTNKRAFFAPRETVYAYDNKGNPKLISIYGGKLTGYRATAEHVMKVVRKSLGRRARLARTDQLSLKADGTEL